MTGQTCIDYGDTTIYNVFTRRFAQENVYDESRGTVMFTKTVVEIMGVLHGNSNSLLHDHSLGKALGTPTSSHRILRATLFHPRRNFEMRVGCNADGSGGETLFSCLASRNVEEGGDPETYLSPNDIDLDNGPKVSDIEISHLTPETFRVSCKFELCKRECDAAGTAGTEINPIKSLVWSVDDDINDNWTTTRTYVGRLQLNHANVDPNSFRGYCVVPLLPGMRRQSMKFTVDKERTALDFQITDAEVHFSAPAPATSWNFSHRVEAAENMNRFGSVSVALASHRYVKKADLINLAMQIVSAKLFRLQQNKAADKTTVLEHIAITDSYGDSLSGIHVEARVRYVGENLDVEQNVVLGRLGKPLDGADLPGYDYRYSFGSAQRGDPTFLDGPISKRGAIVAAFSDACGRFRSLGELARSPEKKPIRGGEEDPGTEGDQDAEIRVTETDALPEVAPQYFSLGHQESIYTYWRMETLNHTQEGVVGLPIAAAPSTGGQTEATKYVRLSRPQAKRTVRVDGERVGSWPNFPVQAKHFDPNGIEVTPLDTKVLAKTADWSPDGKRIYKASIEYTQGLSRAPSAEESLVAGYSPWDAIGLQGIPAEARQTELTSPNLDVGELAQF